MVALKTRIDWLENGKSRGETDTPQGQARIIQAMAEIEWQELPLQAPMMAGIAINEAIKQLKLPRVTHIAISHELAPYGFYGIRTHYSDADVDVFLLDRGSDCFPVCTEVTPKGGS